MRLELGMELVVEAREGVDVAHHACGPVHNRKVVA
jgi:hypothetical protein